MSDSVNKISSSSSSGYNSPGKKTRNKHWKFVKRTFRQSHFAKALLPGGSGHAPLTDDDEEEGRQSQAHTQTQAQAQTQAAAAAANPPQPPRLQQSYSEASTLKRGKRPLNANANINAHTNSINLRDLSSETMSDDGGDQFNDELPGPAPQPFTRNKRTGSLKRLNSYHIHNDGTHHDSFHSASANADDDDGTASEGSKPPTTVSSHSSVEDARQNLLAKAHQRRRLGFLQHTAEEEDFICKTLGMDRVYGKCIRHPNQPITANVHAFFMGTNDDYFCQVRTCRVCQSEMRAGPTALQSSCANLPNMGNVIEQVQRLQSNTQEWDRRTKILGASVADLNHTAAAAATTTTTTTTTANSGSHHTHSVRDETIQEDAAVEEFGGDDSLSLMDLQRHSSSHTNLTGHSFSNPQPPRSSNQSSSSSIKYTEDEWAKQLSRRIAQVRTWEDRFAIKNHPTFCQYFKMLRVGVPLPAVQHAAGMDGYHPSIMELDESKSLTMQLRRLSPQAVENLRTTGALGQVVGGKGTADGDQELSIPETVQKVLAAFRQKRVNQIYATMALFSETKLQMKLQQQQQQQKADGSLLLDEQSITSKSIQSMPNPPADKMADDSNNNNIRLHSAKELNYLDMDDEISQSERIRDEIGSLSTLREVPKALSTERPHIPASSQQSKETAPTESPHTSLSSRRDYLGSPNGSFRARPAEVGPAIQPKPLAPKRLESPSRLGHRSPSGNMNAPSPSRSKKSWTARGVTEEGYTKSPTTLEIADVLAVADHAIEQDRSKRSALLASSPRAASPGKGSPNARSPKKSSPNASSRRSGRKVDSIPTTPRRRLSKEVAKASHNLDGSMPSKSRSMRKVPVSPPIKEVVVSSSDEDAEFVDHEQIEEELHTLIRKESKRYVSHEEDVGRAASDNGAIVTSVDSGTVMPGFTRELSRTSSASYQGVFVPEEDYFKLKGELRLALEAIKSKEEELKNSVRMEEYKRLLSKLEVARSDIAAKQKLIDESVRMVDFVNLSEELESARATIAVKSTTLQESVSKQDYNKLRGEVRSLKERLKMQDLALEDSVALEEYEGLSKEVDQRDGIIGELEREIQKLKKELGSLRILFVEKEDLIHQFKKDGEKKAQHIEELMSQMKTLGQLKRDVEQKDKRIEEFTRRIQTLEKFKKEGEQKDRQIEDLTHQVQMLEKRHTAQVQDSATMQAKIEEAKQRQAALREKFQSPHRVKKAASAPQTDREFEALALSPAVRTQNTQVKRRRKPKDGSSQRSSRSTTISDRASASTRAPPGPSRSESALRHGATPVDATPRQAPLSSSSQLTTPRRVLSTPVHGKKPISSPPLTSAARGSPLPKRSSPVATASHGNHLRPTLDQFHKSPTTKDDDATKEMIMSLFDSWSSKQFASL
jgi:Subunit CCDC53 of WASH complex